MGTRSTRAAPLLALGLSLCATAGRAATATKPAFGVQDLLRLQRIFDVAVSPTADRVAYTQESTDVASNKTRTWIWIQDAAGAGAPSVRIGGGGQNHSPQWSGDGRYLYYLSTQSGSEQVWRVDANGANAVAITGFALDVGSFRVAPAADRLIFSMQVYPDCPDLACTRQRLDGAAKQAATGVLYDELLMRHWDAWGDGRRSQLLSTALDDQGRATGMPVNLAQGLDGDVPRRPFGGREEYAISPDGTQVVFALKAASRTEAWTTNYDLYEVPAQGGAARNLTADNPAADFQPAFSPDGMQLAYVAQQRPGYESDRVQLVLLDLKSGVKRPLTRDWDRSIGRFTWSRDGKTLFAATDHLGQHPLWAVDAASGRAAAITGAGHVESFDVGLKRVFYTQSTLGSPAELYAVGFRGGKPLPLTNANKSALAQVKQGTYEQFSFAGWNGETVYAYLVRPADFKRGGKFPVALIVHGGPHESMANQWHWRWNAEVLAGAGYAVLLIDFHGSKGYGQAFADSIGGDWGGKPLEDLKAGVGAALERYPWLDGKRMCALGGSFGGYMMNWIEGAWPDGFKCLVSHAGVFDNRSMYYSTDELWFPEWEMGAPEFNDPAAYAKYNPVELIERWRTPALVIAGQLDYRVPYSQGLGAFTALQRRGIASELLFFPNENHWILNPADSAQWYETVIRWLDRWTAP